MTRGHFKNIAPLTLLLILVTGSSVVLGSSLDEFVLAIQHFDPDHAQGIRYDSPEVEFVRQALWTARLEANAVKDIHVRTGGSARLPVYRTLELRGGDQLWEDSTATIEMMKAIGEAIGRDCQMAIQTNERRVKGIQKGTKTWTTWTLDSRALHENRTQNCANVEAVDWLCSLGVHSVLIAESVNHRNMYSVNFYLVFGSPIDPEYMAPVLMKAPEYMGIFGDLVAQPYWGNLYGDGPSVEVVSRDGISGFNGISFMFTIGWGDCPAGCINSHYWIIQSLANANGWSDNWEIEAQRVEEGGDPLPGAIRTR